MFKAEKLPFLDINSYYKKNLIFLKTVKTWFLNADNNYVNIKKLIF